MKSMSFALRLFLPFALATAVAAPAAAQDVLVHGHGAFVASNQETHVVSFAAVCRPDGTANGYLVGREPSTGALMGMLIETWEAIDDGVVFAGTVVAVHDAPFVVGGNTFFAVRDGEPDAFAGIGTVPPQFAPLSAAQLVALIGPPPPAAFSPLLVGDITIK